MREWNDLLQTRPRDGARIIATHKGGKIIGTWYDSPPRIVDSETGYDYPAWSPSEWRWIYGLD